MDRDWSILSKLLLGFMHLANEINESLPRFGHALLRPISKLELPYCPGLAILQKQRKGGEKTQWRVYIKSKRRRRDSIDSKDRTKQRKQSHIFIRNVMHWKVLGFILTQGPQMKPVNYYHKAIQILLFVPFKWNKICWCVSFFLFLLPSTIGTSRSTNE